MSPTHRHAFFWVLMLLMTVTSVTGCARGLRAIEPPVARISGLVLVNERDVELDVMVHNLNERPLDIASVRVVVRMDGRPWVDDERPLNWLVTANARESLPIRVLAPSPQVRSALNAVAMSRSPSVPWTMTLTLMLRDGQIIEATSQGFLFRVPGQTKRFR